MQRPHYTIGGLVVVVAASAVAGTLAERKRPPHAAGDVRRWRIFDATSE
jgi:hypothetical protein